MQVATPYNTACIVCREPLNGPSSYSCPKLECQEQIREMKSAELARYNEDGRGKRVRAQGGRPFVRDPRTGLKLRV